MSEPSRSTADRAEFALPETALIGAVETAWAECRQVAGGDILVDLSECRYIDVPSLMFITARVVQARCDGGEAQLRLPRDRRVRDFLRDWAFPNALRDATGVGFRSLVAPSDLSYFGERSANRHTDRASSVLSDSLPGHVYPIRTFFSRSNQYGQRLAAEQSTEWQERYILAVLNKYLKGHGKRVATHIVYEAIMNAVRHPDARFVQTASHFTPPGKAGKGHLTVVFWDDGNGIVTTLRRAFASGRSIRPAADDSLHRTLSIKFVDPAGQVTKVTTSTKESPSSASSDEELLLAATFPGVTSLPMRPTNDAHPDVAAREPLLAAPGMGLFVLINTAVDVFGGTVSIRTGRQFMNIKAGSRAMREGGMGELAVKVQTDEQGLPAFPGNMLTVRLPIEASKSK